MPKGLFQPGSNSVPFLEVFVSQAVVSQGYRQKRNGTKLSGPDWKSTYEQIVFLCPCSAFLLSFASALRMLQTKDFAEHREDIQLIKTAEVF